MFIIVWFQVGPCAILSTCHAVSEKSGEGYSVEANEEGTSTGGNAPAKRRRLVR